MSERDDVFAATVTTSERRPGAPERRRVGFVGASARARSGWDWEADELGTPDRAELEELRAERTALAKQVAELEVAVAEAGKLETVLRDALRRSNDAGWREKRRLARELRETGLLGGRNAGEDNASRAPSPGPRA